MPIALVVVIVAAGIHAVRETPVDAIPDISENQAIVFTRWSGRSPQDVENQVTYPLSTDLQGIPGVREVRGLSGFGFSQIYVVFEDDVPFYWARTRVLERLSTAKAGLPKDATPELGPDATPLGQVFWYTLEGEGQDLATLRSLQDYVVRYALQAVPGVSEVAGVGGFVRQYQIDVDPRRLLHYGLDVADVQRAVSASNIDVGAKTIERSGMELVVRGLGAIEKLADVEDIVVTARDGVPIFLKHVADVSFGPDFRRGALADEHGERVGGVVTMRFGENPRRVIEGVQAAIDTLQTALPKGVRIVPFYDRTQLVDETMGTLETALLEELAVTVAVILLFLLNVRASLIVAVTLPLAVLLAFIAMRVVGVGSNIMSLAGIAIAIGTVVDMGIVMSENIFSRLNDAPDGADRRAVIADAATEVAPAIITAVATTVVSFLPVFLLTGQAHKLFAPLAWTKTFALTAALLVATAFVPVLWRFGRSKAAPIERNPVSRLITSVYRPTLTWILDHKAIFALVPLTILFVGMVRFGGARLLTAPWRATAEVLGGDPDRIEPFASLDRAFPPIGQAFMPPLEEGSFLFMPSLLHQASLSETMDVMIRLNRAIRTVPEVSQVVGKLGRADTALDPAPVGMMETVVNLKPRHMWRPGSTPATILADLRAATKTIGLSPSWLQPIETRIVMLQSGLKASMALELIGAPLAPDGEAYRDLDAHARLEQAALAMESVIAGVEGAVDVSALRLGGKPYVEIAVDRRRAARHGVTVEAVLNVVEVALGGRNLTWSLEGRERYPVRVQYARELRDDPDELGRLLVPAPHGEQVPLADLVDIREVVGPASVRTRDGQLTAYVMFNAKDRDEQSVMDDAMAAVASWRAEQARDTGADPIPAGVRIEPAGRYLDKLEADARLRLLVPIVIFINLFLLYLAYRDIGLTLSIFAAIPIVFAGGFIGLWLWPLLTGETVYLTTAVWIGFIALFGIAVDDGAVMATYLQQSFRKLKPGTRAEVRAAVLEAGLRRIRPCLMSTFTTILALVPVLLSDGRGSDVMRPMALPLVGGMAAELITLFVLPTLYSWLREREVPA